MFTKKETMKAKGIAICLLLFHHLFYSESRLINNEVIFNIIPENIILRLGLMCRICVWIFAFLSAYGLTCQYLQKKNSESVEEFVFKRWFSVMKSYWFVYIIFFVLSFIFFKKPYTIYEGRFLYGVLDFLGISDFFATPMMSAVWWYICFSQVMIFLLPVIILFCKKFGWISIGISFVGMQYLDVGIKSTYGGLYVIYLLVTLLGVICAQKNVFDKIKFEEKNILVYVLKGTILSLVLAIFCYVRTKIVDMDVWNIGSLINAFVALGVCIFSFKYIRIKKVEKILMFLGQHSGNIFLCHAFFYVYYERYIYYTKNVFFSWLTLMLISVFVSMLIEYVKKVIKYNEDMSLLYNHIYKIIFRKSIN